MQRIRRFRRDAHPLAVLGAYVALQALLLGLVALPGGYELIPNWTQLGLQLVLVLFVARGSHLAWALLLAWEVFGAALALTLPFVLTPSTAGEGIVNGVLLAVSVLSLWLLSSPSLRDFVQRRRPVPA